MNQVIYGLHTGEAKKQISYREAKGIEMIFGTSFSDENHACSQFFKEGISKFWIEEVISKQYKKYILHLRVNLARASGIGDYCLMPYTIPNVKKTRRVISKVLKQLKLNDKNADFGEWKVERLDTAVDVEVAFPDMYMTLLDKSLDVNAYKRKCKRVYFTPTNPDVCESIRFGNDSYTYNVYIKLADLINKGITITPEILQEVKNIVRIERQNKQSALKQLLKERQIKDLESVSVRDAILKTLIEDVEAFWGKGNYYSAHEVKAEFGGVSDVIQLIPAMVKFTENSLETEYAIYSPEIKQQFKDYGIMPVGICREDAHKHQIHKIEGPYNMVTNIYAIPDKRTYNVFPIPHLCSDGRYKAGITFHMVNDTRKQPVSIAKSELDAYEETVLRELKRAYVTNIKHHCSVAPIPELKDKSADDILRFYQVVQTKSVKEDAKSFIKTMNLKKNKQV